VHEVVLQKNCIESLQCHRHWDKNKVSLSSPDILLLLIFIIIIIFAEKPSGDQDVKLLRNARKATLAGGSLSDDEPLYDSVCSDEDYASIGDNQSVQEESSASKTQVTSSKETLDTMVMSSLLLDVLSPL